MTRRLLNLLTSLSLLLCDLSAVLWVRSHRREDSIVWQGSHPAGIVAPGERWVGVE